MTFRVNQGECEAKIDDVAKTFKQNTSSIGVLETKLDKLERESLACDVIMTGIPESKNEDLSNLKRLITMILKAINYNSSFNFLRNFLKIFT